jgi:hypothetical protein
MSTKITITLSDEQARQLREQAEGHGTNPATHAADMVKIQLSTSTPETDWRKMSASVIILVIR